MVSRSRYSSAIFVSVTLVCVAQFSSRIGPPALCATRVLGDNGAEVTSVMSQVRSMPVAIPAVVGPALSMLLGGMAGGRLEITSRTLCASQYFSAGMILAVCGNLTHDLSEHGIPAALALCVGFSLGVATMVIVKKLAGSEDETRVSASVEALKVFPWSMAVAIAIDSLMDGLLIGLVGSENPRAVPMMSGATALEMGALGLSFSTALSQHRKVPRAICIIAMPLALILGGIVGAVATAPLRHSPLAYTGMVAFAMASLVYLVTQELLVEAEKRARDLSDGAKLATWLFAGYLFVLAIDVVVPEY